MFDCEDFLNALEGHTLATISNKDNEHNADTSAGRQYREQAEDRLKYARMSLAEELNKFHGR